MINFEVRAKENMDMKARVLGTVTMLDQAILEFGRTGEKKEFFKMMESFKNFEALYKAWVVTMHGEMRAKYMRETKGGTCPIDGGEHD